MIGIDWPVLNEWTQAFCECRLIIFCLRSHIAFICCCDNIPLRSSGLVFLRDLFWFFHRYSGEEIFGDHHICGGLFREPMCLLKRPWVATRVKFMESQKLPTLWGLPQALHGHSDQLKTWVILHHAAVWTLPSTENMVHEGCFDSTD